MSHPEQDSPSTGDLAATCRRFAEDRYVRLPAVLRPGLQAFFYDVVMDKAQAGVLNYANNQVPGAPAGLADPVMQRLLEVLLPQFEAFSGLQLYPTYSFVRVYRRGDDLKKHTDRPLCEVSVSLCLGYAAEHPWPLFIEGPNGVSGVELAPGDAVLYRGIECPHWREPFTGDHAAQVFLHYVDRNGPHAGLRFTGQLG